MPFVRNMSVRVKLFSGFGAVLALTAALGIVLISQIGSVNSISQTVSTSDFPSVVVIGDIAHSLNDYQASTLEGIIETKPAIHAIQLQSATQDAQAIDSALREYGPLAGPGQDTLDYHKVQAQWSALKAANAPLLSGQVTQGPATAALVYKLDVNTFSPLQSLVESWKKVNGDIANADAQKISSTYGTARTLGIVLLACAVLFGLAVAFVLARAITRSVTQVLRAAQAIADDGDLEQRIDVKSGDEIGAMAQAVTRMIDSLRGTATVADRIAEGDLTADVTPKSDRDQLGNAFARMIKSLRELIGNVTAAAGTVGAASQQMATTSEESGRATGEIAQAISDVAAGAEHQVRMIGDARTSADEVARAVAEAAAQAELTAQAAQEAREAAKQGVGAAEEANAAMDAVRESSAAVTTAIQELATKSDQIGAIVATISGIAEQTNLLALNAAIEAARAGDQGRGFAVVADEVRKLAEEAQGAAREISELIGGIQTETNNAVDVVKTGAARTEQGAAVVQQSRAAFLQIGTSVEDIGERIEQIAAGAQQVAAGAQSMQSNINEIASVVERSSASSEEVSASTQQSSASAQEVAAAASELSRNAEDLNRLVANFKLAA